MLRHSDIRDQDVDRFAVDQLQRLRDASRGEHLRAASLEHGPHELTCVLLVVHHEHAQAVQLRRPLEGRVDDDPTRLAG